MKGFHDSVLFRATLAAGLILAALIFSTVLLESNSTPDNTANISGPTVRILGRSN